MNLRKKNYVVRTLTAEPPRPTVQASTLLGGPLLPPPFKRTYFMDDFTLWTLPSLLWVSHSTISKFNQLSKWSFFGLVIPFNFFVGER